MTKVTPVQRFAGIFIDGLAVSVLSFIFGFIAGATGIMLIATLGYLVSIGFYLLRDALFGGQSIGKKIMKYKVVKADGTSLANDYKTSAIRNASLFIPLYDAIMVLTDKPRLGDGWANTSIQPA